jgi:ABC-type multidrug transport system permease subunit
MKADRTSVLEAKPISKQGAASPQRAAAEGEQQLPRESVRPRNGRWQAYCNLLVSRLRELQREPEVIFWVFVFPLLLAALLGLAFRDSQFEALVAGPAFHPAGKSRYIDFLIPGLLGMTLMNSGMWGIGFAVVEMRQRKLLKRLAATPMRPSDFLLALSTSRVLLVIVEIGLLLGFGVAVFDTQIVGSLFSVFTVALVGAAAFACIALLVACRAEKIETVNGIANSVMLALWVLSGVFFSYQRFPKPLLRMISYSPLAVVNDALRAIICEGSPLHAQLHRLALIALWGLLSFVLAVRWFRWA